MGFVCYRDRGKNTFKLLDPLYGSCSNRLSLNLLQKSTNTYTRLFNGLHVNINGYAINKKTSKYQIINFPKF